MPSYTFMDSYLSFLNAKCELLDFPINLFLHLLTISDGCFHRQMTKSIFQVLLLKETFHQSSRKSRLSKFPPCQSFSCRRFTNIWNDTYCRAVPCLILQKLCERVISFIGAEQTQHHRTFWCKTNKHLKKRSVLSTVNNNDNTSFFVMLSYCSILLHICYWFSIVTPPSLIRLHKEDFGVGSYNVENFPGGS